MSPAEFVMDVLMLRRGREVPGDILEKLGYPVGGSVVFRDWVELTPLILSEHILFTMGNLRGAIISELDCGFLSGGQDLKTAYFNIGQGFLLDVMREPARAAQTLSCNTLAKLFGNTMNIASDLREAMLAEGPQHSVCVLLGTELFTLCCEHHQYCQARAFSEGSGREPLSLFKDHSIPAKKDEVASGRLGIPGYPPLHPDGVGQPLWGPPGEPVQPGEPQAGPDPESFHRRVRRRYWEHAGGLPPALPFRHEDGQAEAPGAPLGPHGAPDGSDLAFLGQGSWIAPPAGHGQPGYAGEAGWAGGGHACPAFQAPSHERKRRAWCP